MDNSKDCKSSSKDESYYQCEIGHSQIIRNKINEVLKAFPNDNLNRANFLAIDRNLRIHQLESRANIFCLKKSSLERAQVNSQYKDILNDLKTLSLEIKKAPAEEGWGRKSLSLSEDKSSDLFCQNLNSKKD